MLLFVPPHGLLVLLPETAGYVILGKWYWKYRLGDCRKRIYRIARSFCPDSRRNNRRIVNYVTVIATQKLDESLLRIAGLFSSLGESAKLRGQIGGFPEKAPYGRPGDRRSQGELNSPVTNRQAKVGKLFLVGCLNILPLKVYFRMEHLMADISTSDS
uniref:Uncharacterized protein n=1 Tax=Candidatus Kentrum sp. FM TaxID=2126340 RepID=A0A450SHW5_9GAMM|nr:MAG: hypothetical protein BECKFM1743C_GA0114222_101152 [Candidatus Kentron sp. FM]